MLVTLVSMKQPTITPISGTTWNLDKNYHETIKDSKGNLHQIDILSGFDFDGASIPRCCWSALGFYPTSPQTLPAALVHDALYASETFSRYECDYCFYNALRRQGVGYFKANAMYYAVRVGGANVWKNHSLKEVMYYKMLVRVW